MNETMAIIDTYTNLHIDLKSIVNLNKQRIANLYTAIKDSEKRGMIDFSLYEIMLQNITEIDSILDDLMPLVH